MIVVTLADRPELEERLSEIGDTWPEFIHHGDVTNLHWDHLYTEFGEYQLALYDEERDVVAGKGNTIPVAWDGTVEGLSGGVDASLAQGLALRERGVAANTLCAVVAVVDPRRQGEGLSSLIIEGMRATAERRGLGDLIAPVRPTWKSRYPLTPMEHYAAWRREDGLPFDPWIRLHVRLGGQILAVCPESLVVTGTAAEWEGWTGMAFPESGEYVVEGALVPVRIDRELDVGRYAEPNLWMRHRARPAAAAAPEPA